MNIACIFDIHGNYPALKAVFNDLEKYSIDKIVIGGDFLTGPMPLETLDELLKHKEKICFIRGNGEDDILKSLQGESPDHLSEAAQEAVNWVSSRLGGGYEHFLEALPLSFEIEHDYLGSFTFCHAVPDSTTKIFTKRTGETELRLLFHNMKTGHVICGHTHLQFRSDINGLKIYNAGSVGMSFSSHRGADWILISDTEISFKNTGYDYDECKEILAGTGYPGVGEFIENNILKIHNEDDVLDYLESLRPDQCNGA